MIDMKLLPPARAEASVSASSDPMCRGLSRREVATNMINVCWVQEAGELAEWGFPLARELLARGVKVRFALKLRATQQAAERWDCAWVFVPSETYHGPSLSREELLRLDRHYGPPCMAALAQSNSQFDWLRLPLGERIQIVARHYRFWERYLDEHPTDFVFFTTLGTVESRTLYNAARARGIPYFQFSIGPAPGTFTMNDVGETLCWQELLDGLAQGVRELSPEEMRTVRAVVEDASTRPQEKVAPNTRWAPASRRLWWAFVKEEVAGVYRTAQARIHWKDYPIRALQGYAEWSQDPVSVAVRRQISRLRKEQLRWKHWTSRFFSYDRPVPGEPFVYFPLFHYYEGTTLAVSAYWARNALSLVSHVASLLPEGYQLYVKEHPIHLGQRWTKELRELKRHPRIRVIDPTHPGRNLVQDSSAVLVVEGTSGWEALLNRKPLVVLGSRFYARCSLAYLVRRVEELEDALWAAIRDGGRIYDERAKEWLWFIWCAVSTSGQGMLQPVQYPYVVPTDQQNLAIVADSVVAKVRRVLAAQTRLADREEPHCHAC